MITIITRSYSPSVSWRIGLKRISLVTCWLCMSLLADFNANGQTHAAASGTNIAKERDGQRDFDFEIGKWKTQLKRLTKPLTGSTSWVEYEGTTTVTRIWDGKANLVELVADGPAGHFEGLNLRLYNPETRQWSLNFSSVNSGAIAIPAIGDFKDGRGEFYNQETLYGRSIFVRFVISILNPDSVKFEQSFSEDGGKTWELNWIAIDTRMK